MRQIRLKAQPEYSYKCEFNIIDTTDSAGKRRGAITVDYGEPEINQLLEQNMDFDGAMEYYRQKIYDLVKRLISDEWECSGGMEEAESIIAKYIKPSFNG